MPGGDDGFVGVAGIVGGDAFAPGGEATGAQAQDEAVALLLSAKAGDKGGDEFLADVVEVNLFDFHELARDSLMEVISSGERMAKVPVTLAMRTSFWVMRHWVVMVRLPLWTVSAWATSVPARAGA